MSYLLHSLSLLPSSSPLFPFSHSLLSGVQSNLSLPSTFPVLPNSLILSRHTRCCSPTLLRRTMSSSSWRETSSMSVPQTRDKLVCLLNPSIECFGTIFVIIMMICLQYLGYTRRVLIQKASANVNSHLSRVNMTILAPASPPVEVWRARV